MLLYFSIILYYTYSYIHILYFFPHIIDYIFSNNKINNLIYTTFINQDEDIIPYYISMIKSISFFLNYDTSKFFFNEVSKKELSMCILS